MYSFQVACGRGARCCRCTWKQTRNLCLPMGPGSSGATRLRQTGNISGSHSHTCIRSHSLLPPSSEVFPPLPFRPSQKPVQSPSVKMCHLSPPPSSYSNLIGHVEAQRHQRCLLEVQTQLASPSGCILGACFRAIWWFRCCGFIRLLSLASAGISCRTFRLRVRALCGLDQIMCRKCFFCLLHKFQWKCLIIQQRREPYWHT